MTTPALQRLRERFPQAHIALLTHRKLADLWRHHPSLNSVLAFAPGENPWPVARRLRAEHFDAALVLPNSPRSALEVWLARIPRRIGYARPWRNWFLTQALPSRPGRQPLRKRPVSEIQQLTKVTPAPASIVNRQSSIPNPSVHQVYEYLHLVAALGADPAPLPPELHVTPAEIEAVARRFGLPLNSDQRSTHPLLGLNAGAEYGPAKRWPSERFIAAAAEVQRRINCRWLIFGGKAETQLAGDIASGIHRAQSGAAGAAAELPSPLNVAGQTSLRELMALLKLCRVVLTNDTGPMHVAAALGTPVVVPFGSTSPELTGPGLPGDSRHHLLKSDAHCSPCFRRVCPIDFRCMTGISVEQVVAAVLQRLDKA